MPYAIAAKFAHPQRPVIALVGDGAMQMHGISAMVTVAHHWNKWQDPCFIVIVLNNSDLNMVTWEQRVTEGEPKSESSQVLPGFAYAEYAKLLGLRGIRVDRPQTVGLAWDEALCSDRPTLVEMVTDPNVPPVPPHVGSKQVRHYARALLHRDPQALEVVKATAKEWWASLKPSSRA